MMTPNRSVLYLLLATALLLSTSIPAAAQTIHAVVAADTVSKDISLDMEQNVSNITVSLTLNIPRESLNLIVLKGERFSSDIVLSVIREIKADSNDSILFFYCGHGYYTEGIGSFFVPPADNGDRLYLKDIRSAMQAHGTRLVISIVDCCSLTPTGEKSRSYAAPAGPTVMSPLFTELFLNTTGDIAVNSSAPGEFALCGSLPDMKNVHRAGSLFTNALNSAILKNSHRQISWEDVILKVKSDVATEFNGMRRNGTKLTNGQVVDFQESQTVWAIRDGKDWIPFDSK